jgi:hypothetical protein
MHSTQKSVLVFAFVVIASGPAHAATHMGVSAGDHVVLESISGASGGCASGEFEFQQILSDGTRAQGFFRVPARKVLVVTDVDWRYRNTAAPAGTNELLQLFIGNLADPGVANIALETLVTLDGQGEAGRNHELTSGIVVSSGARLCPEVHPGNVNPLGPTPSLQVYVRGYLTTDR